MRVEKIIIILFCAVIASCNGNSQVEPSKTKTEVKVRYGGELNKPKQSEFSLDSTLIFVKFNNENVDLLKRYLAGNSRWEIRKEKKYRRGDEYPIPYEVTYAIRKEERDGKFETTLNGYYSNFGESTSVYQTRVIISFDDTYGNGNDTSHITYATQNDNNVKTIIESEHAGAPGNSSYFILNGPSINIEIYEQSKIIERDFTVKTLQDLNEELSEVLKNLDHIEKTGVLPDNRFYPSQIDSKYFEIEDGMQPGIYLVKAGLSLKEKGSVYIKVFNTNTNERLSADRMTPRTTREIGWSIDGKTIFPYESELTVYEGDWSHEYNVRFEIWFKPENGEEIKLDQKERIINGWQR
jgi:hypothetical protein